MYRLRSPHFAEIDNGFQKGGMWTEWGSSHKPHVFEKSKESTHTYISVTKFPKKGFYFISFLDSVELERGETFAHI